MFFYTFFQVLTEKNLKETILAHQKERENYLKEVCGVLYVLLMSLKIILVFNDAILSLI